MTETTRYARQLVATVIRKMDELRLACKDLARDVDDPMLRHGLYEAQFNLNDTHKALSTVFEAWTKENPEVTE